MCATRNKYYTDRPSEKSKEGTRTTAVRARSSQQEDTAKSQQKTTITTNRSAAKNVDLHGLKIIDPLLVPARKTFRARTFLITGTKCISTDSRYRYRLAPSTTCINAATKKPCLGIFATGITPHSKTRCPCFHTSEPWTEQRPNIVQVCISNYRLPTRFSSFLLLAARIPIRWA